MHGTSQPIHKIQILIPSGLFSVFHLYQLLAAKNNFSPQNEIGRGGFGIVYKVVGNIYCLLSIRDIDLLDSFHITASCL